MSKRDYKDDKNKVRMELLPMDCLVKVAEVLTEGAKKYKVDSWKTVKNGRKRYIGALMRHLAALQDGKNIYDNDNGALHAAHLVCNALFILWYDMQIERKRDEVVKRMLLNSAYGKFGSQNITQDYTIMDKAVENMFSFTKNEVVEK